VEEQDRADLGSGEQSGEQQSLGAGRELKWTDDAQQVRAQRDAVDAGSQRQRHRHRAPGPQAQDGGDREEAQSQRETDRQAAPQQRVRPGRRFCGQAREANGGHCGEALFGWIVSDFGLNDARTVVAGRRTYAVSSTALRTQGVYVRTGFVHYNCFSPTWYRQYPGAWFVAGWTASAVWRAATWGTVSAYGGYPSESVTYDYGTNIVYEATRST
jgi:hypothetical protein